MKNTGKSIKYLLVLAGIVIGLGFIYVYYSINPAGQDWMPKCPFHSLTGLHCPGCGSQRALHDFLHGNFIEGFKHNFLIGLGILVLIYKLILMARERFYPTKNSNILTHSKTPWIILILILSFWVLRNIPYEPFTYLAP